MTFVMIALIVLSSSFGDILVSRGMKEVGEVNTFNIRQLFKIGGRVLTNPAFISGIAGQAVAFFSLIAVLSWAPLSLVSPATALSYVVNTIGAKYYLKEEVDGTRWLGTLLVCIGAAFISIEEH